MSAPRPTPLPELVWEPRWVTDAGMTVLLEEDHAIPIVDVCLVVKSGALFDPPGKEGLARIAARMLRMGTRSLDAERVDAAVDAMGASMSVDVGHGTLQIRATVIRRSLSAFLDLLGRLVTAPALRSADLGLVAREAVDELRKLRDDDRWLANRAFRAHLFGEHPYGRPTTGSIASIPRITRSDVATFLKTHVVAENVVLAVAGDVTEAELRTLVGRAFARMPRGRAPAAPLPEPALRKGRRVLVVDKPERTQTQIFVGTLGTWVADALYHPLFVANTAFGGTFTSRLVREVRSERGWSYAVHARLGADRQREAWVVYTHPSTANAADCIALELDLITAFVEDGITATELAAARDFLTKSHAFDLDTASKRLDLRLDAEVQGMPREFYTRYVEHVRRVGLARANEAVRARLSHDDLSIVLLASASSVADRLQALPGVQDLAVVPFDEV